MNEFEKFMKRLTRRGYKVIRTYKKDFGERLISEWKRGFMRTDRRVLIHHFCNRKPSIKDFGEFVKDFEKFLDSFGRNYDIEGGYFITYGEYDKKGFNLISSRLDREVRELIKIISLKEEKVRKGKRIIKEKMPRVEKITVKKIIRRIKAFKPHRRPKRERELEQMLVSNLQAYYPNIRTQLTYERARIDVQIDNIGIEIKYQPDEGSLDRLYGQVDKYLKHLDSVIAVIGYEKSAESIRRFRNRLKERGWLGKRVFVVSVP